MWLWWLALPTILRRLISAVLLLAAIAGALALWHHRAFTSGYDAGHKAGADSAWLADKRKQQVALDSIEHRADSLATIAKHDDSLVARQAAALRNAPRYTPRFAQLPDTIPIRVDTARVQVIVESTADTIPDVPRKAARYWFQSDSTLGEALKANAQFLTANRSWSTAYYAEHAAREGADSLASAWRVRALAVQPPQHSGHTRQVVTVVLSLVTGYFIARHIR